MTTMLNKILAVKAQEVIIARQMRSEAELLREAKTRQDVRGFAQAIENKIATNKPAIIAELKKASPSLGLLRKDFKPAEIATTYATHGAACLSVLTDVQFFQGSHDYLRQARAACPLPILRKDFIIDPYQIPQSRALGADCILLIVAALEPQKLKALEAYAMDLGMDVLVEVHNAAELDIALELNTPLLGINNRNLQTFETQIQTTLDLLPRIPSHKRVITESGISTPKDIKLMRKNKVHAFLIGESLMKSEAPGVKLAQLIG